MFEDSNIKIASIVIGILFIIGLIFLANRFGGQLRNRLQSQKTPNVNITPTPSQMPSQSFGQIIGQGQTKGESVQNSQPPKATQIPNTGAETLVIPGLIATLFIGFKLKSYKIN